MSLFSPQDVLQAIRTANSRFVLPEFQPDQEFLCVAAVGSATSYSRSWRNLKVLSALTGAAIVCSTESAKRALSTIRRVGTLFVETGVWGWCGYRTEVGDLVRLADRQVHFANDYSLRSTALSGSAQAEPGFAFRLEHTRKKNYHLWSTVPAFRENCVSGGVPDQFHLVNWNALSWGDLKPLPDLPVSGVVYYGAARERRIPDLHRYLAESNSCIITGTQGDVRKFTEKIPGTQVVQRRMSAAADCLDAGSLTLYLHDPYIDKHVTPIPNDRFFECLVQGIPMAIDQRAAPTLEAYGVDPSRWLVRNQPTLLARVDDALRIQREQRGLAFTLDPLAGLASQLSEAFEALE